MCDGSTGNMRATAPCTVVDELELVGALVDRDEAAATATSEMCAPDESNLVCRV